MLVKYKSVYMKFARRVNLMVFCCPMTSVKTMDPQHKISQYSVLCWNPLYIPCLNKAVQHTNKTQLSPLKISNSFFISDYMYKVTIMLINSFKQNLVQHISYSCDLWIMPTHSGSKFVEIIGLYYRQYKG